MVCYCRLITEDQVVSTIEMMGLRSVREVRDATGAGDGCTCCHKRIRNLLGRTELATVSS